MENLGGRRKVILITGSSRGIGEYLAKYYTTQNFIVIGCSRSGAAFTHENYHHIVADISKEEEILNIYKYIRKEFKYLDILVNNAAINPAILSAALLPYETIQNVYKVNVFAPMVFCREAIKMMARHKWGRIINLGTMATKHEVAGEALYTSSKAAILAYTRVIAKEIYRQGITANVVAPSAIHTELSMQINQEALKEVLARNAINDFGKFTDVSNMIDLLINEESSAVTGQIIYLGGV